MVSANSYILTQVSSYDQKHGLSLFLLLDNDQVLLMKLIDS